MSKQYENESEEMYLETILVLKQKMEFVRSIDVVNEMGYSKPSVSRAVKLLKERGFITVGKGGALEFTPEGLEAAKAVYERHKVITRLFTDVLGVDPETAEEDACRIEHVISETSFEKLKERLKNEYDLKA
jgi:DtxR family Mn-dependent transcriptional regulator